jgi:ADP-ribose pyrophosphatase
VTPTCADAKVTLTDRDSHRWLLMVRPGDRDGWALPGGHIDDAEEPLAAAVRELAEETGLVLPAAAWRTHLARSVPDVRFPGGSVVTVLHSTHIGVCAVFPPVTGGDDADEAAWMRADDYEDLVRYLAEHHDGIVFPAHVDMIRDALAES